MTDVELYGWRKLFEGAWSDDTAVPGSGRQCSSAGQCAATAIALRDLLTQHGDKVELVSTRIQNESHWFVRVNDADVDITGDQFGFAPVRVAVAGQLYPDTRVRDISEANDETRARADKLVERICGVVTF